ncbi:hypothetical protein E3P92_02420 [Wallemia ichthyophaga]|nr:hypothetical protein E3P95_02075 [Wallemia ichthyophaga]TIB00337.1 hypothetical protein E3P94_02199 [Wallemia ichthyophaga]TIB12937.1 hypothetical protein E3P92_02420 [Wallemia ichthyophaga]
MEIHDDDPHRHEYFEDNDSSGVNPSITNIPNSADLSLKSNVSNPQVPHAPLPIPSDPASLPYPSDFTDDLTQGASTGSNASGVAGSLVDEDFFTSMSTQKPKKAPTKPDPNQLQVSSREINHQFKAGKHVDDYHNESKKSSTPGDAGSSWRMMKLKRCYEHAEEEGTHVDNLGIDRFGSIEAWRDAQHERSILDERDAKRFNRRGGRRDSYASGRESPRNNSNNSPRNIYTSPSTSDYGSRPSSRASFKRPSDTHTPTRSTQYQTTQGGQTDRVSHLRGESKPSSPVIPKVFTPTTSVSGGGAPGRPKSPDSLNKLQAQVMKARLMSTPNLQQLEMEYEHEMEIARKLTQTGGDAGHGLMNVNLNDKTGLEPVEKEQKTKIEVLPTLDGHGRLYDVGQGRKDDSLPVGNNTNNSSKRKKAHNHETRDERTGEITRYNIDDDDQSLAELVRQERFAGGASDQKNYDAEFANAITSDHLYEHGDTDQIDDNAARYARKKMKSDAQKRQFAIGDYKRTKRVLDNCRWCFGDDGEAPPRCRTIVSSGTRVYLALPEHEQLVDGHCLIVPMQHCLSSLEADDDVWEEIRNYMKCLMQTFASQNRGVVFYETVLSIRAQLHTAIEAVPVPADIYQVLPGYFHESILAIESEWTQHKKLINFQEREFRRALVPNLPYFAIMWDYKGNAGYGHVIEGVDKANSEDDSESKYHDQSQAFPRYFAAEVIGNVLELEPKLWRRPRRLHGQEKSNAVEKFKKLYLEYDWTKMLRQLSRAVNPIRSARSARSAKSAQSVRGYASSRPAQLPVFNTNADKVWMATSAFVTIGGVVWLTSPGEDAHHDSHHDDAHHQVSEKAEEVKEVAKEEASEGAEEASQVKENVKEKTEDASEKAEDVKDDVKEDVKEVASDAKDQAADVKDDVKDKAENVTENAQEKAVQVKEDVKEDAKEVSQEISQNKDEIKQEVSEKTEN